MKTLSWGAALLAVVLTAVFFFGRSFVGGAETSAEVSIQPAEEAVQAVLRREAGWIEGRGMRIEALLPLAYEVPAEQLVIEAELPEDLYDVSVRTRAGDEFQALRKALEAKFGWKSDRETSRQEVYVLRALPDRERRMAPRESSDSSRSKFSCSAGELTGSSVTTDRLASQLSTLVRAPVVDETGLDGVLTLDLRWEPGNRQDLISTLRDEVALELAPEVRAVEMVIIRSKSPP